MRIGLDFDNTIVSYDALFYKVARERDCIPVDTSVNKVAVRDHLRSVDREALWTEMQGYVYGARMDEAIAYDGALEFIRRATIAGHQVFIVSHKTRHPFIGEQYDLHAAARTWVAHHLRHQGAALLADDSIFFELTKAEKLARIAACDCDAFVDDLPEILLASDFPGGVSRLLFEPEAGSSGVRADGLTAFKNWQQIADHFAL